jgi:hypothetical protein
MARYIEKDSALKVIYDFKEKHTEDRKDYPLNYGTLLDFINQIRDLPAVDAIPIPEGATNGDVIKAMFPNCEQKENIHNGYFEMYFDGDFGNPSYMRVREYWWNAPYRNNKGV